MRIYSQDLLRRLRKWTAERGIHLIADEIMTGFYRTGKRMACEHAEIEPDFLCLSKGMTSGFLPLSAVVTTQAVYECFYDEYESGKSFLHSHTYSGNALAASVALEAMKVMEEENIEANVFEMSRFMQNALTDIAERTGRLQNVRSLGAIAAADLLAEKKSRFGFQVYKEAVRLGALIRPLGNTLYWLPPLTTEIDTLKLLQVMTEKAVLI